MKQKELIEKEKENNYRILTECPYCSAKLVKRGLRKKKYETVENVH